MYIKSIWTIYCKKHGQCHNPGSYSGHANKSGGNQGESHNPIGLQDMIKKEIKCCDCKHVSHKMAVVLLKRNKVIFWFLSALKLVLFMFF